MTHRFVFSPKHLIALTAIVLGSAFQLSAQTSDAFAYATPATAKNADTPEKTEKNVMARQGCKLDVQQEGARDLRFLVQVDNPAGAKLMLFIKDSNNNTLYKESLSATSPRFVARYNLEKLEDGNYTIEIHSGKNKLEKALEIKTQMSVNRVVSVEE